MTRRAAMRADKIADAAIFEAWREISTGEFAEGCENVAFFQRASRQKSTR